MKPFVLAIEGYFFAFAMLLLRATCSVRVAYDPRAELRSTGEPYVYSILHAHQASAAINREKGTAAMVSASADGQLLVAGFWALGIISKRGSNQGRKGDDKGGLLAIDQMVEHVAGGRPALLAVDGPRGPRNRVRKGIAVLSRRSGGAVLNVVLVPSRRWVLRGAWDRMQIPKPFCRIDAYFAEPLRPRADESVEAYRLRIEASLNDLEHKHDPAEAPPRPRASELPAELDPCA
ncbi:MAG: DUF374 domain-containing protein [Planctomycetota bacterium]